MRLIEVLAQSLLVVAAADGRLAHRAPQLARARGRAHVDGERFVVVVLPRRRGARLRAGPAERAPTARRARVGLRLRVGPVLLALRAPSALLPEPTGQLGLVAKDEALELALALSQAEAEAEEAEAEEAGGGVSPPPPQRAPLLPPGLSVPPGLAMLPSRLPVVPHLAEHSGTQGGPAGLGASAASAPLDFAGWANCALEACTGHDDNVQLIEFMLGFSSLDDEIEYLGESVGASRGLQDEWLAHRLSEEP
mmetsp:Transcript_16104/g.41038  ORF Transcript_16104/g.41038 Transcript_16104/m.41038 type:complete len:251 (-) Transcript_16104:37-789(-)